MGHSIKEVADIAKVSVRTLHHYDRIGLLSPRKLDNGYRIYDDADLKTLQSILFYKYLGFSLKEIAGLMQGDIDRISLLERQLQLIEQEQRRMEELVRTLKRSIEEEKGGPIMTAEEKFKGLTWNDSKEYENEARERYGNDIIDAGIARQKGKEDEATDAFNDVFFAFARNLEQGIAPDAAENIAIAQRLLNVLRTYSFDCSIEVFGHIGKGYAADPRFKANIDKFGEGTAQYASDAITAFVKASA